MTVRRAALGQRTVGELERALRTLRACSRVLVRASREEDLLAELCRVIVEEAGYRLAWVGLAVDDEYGSVTPAAQAGFEEGYLETLRISWRDNERGRGPTGTAIRTGRHVVARNIAGDPSFAPWRQQAVERGYASSIALPLKLRDESVGALNIYSERPDAFDSFEEELLVEIAENLALGISALRGEAARGQAEERLHRIVESMPVLMDAFDEDGNIVAWNRAAEELTGYRAEEIIGNEKALELLYPDRDYRTQMLEEWERRGDDYIGWQWVVTAKDGSLRTVEWSNISERFPIPGWRTWGVGVDVTERLENERRYGDLFENVPIGLWVEDASEVKRILDGIDPRESGGWREYFSEHPEVVERCAAAIEVIDVNAAAVALHQARTKEELLGNLDRIFGAESLATFVDELVSLAEGKFEFETEGVALTMEGDPIWITIRLRVPPGDEDRWSRILVSTADVSARRRAEEEMLRSQKLESLGILAGGIAHDFNNLLMSVLGGADLALQHVPKRSPARQSLEDVVTAAHRAGELANQLLAYSGKGKFVVEPVDLSALMAEISHLVEAAVSKKVRIVYDLDPDLPAIEVDVTQARQIALNLVTNAAEAIGGEGGEVSITTGSRQCDQEYLTRAFAAGHLRAGRYVYFQVRDTGRGMDAETRQRIFDPFFSTKPTGRGIGLAATLGIVRGHGGAIRVESQPGLGTTFTVLFPASERALLRGAEPAAEQPWTGSGTVLLVDDEATVRAVAEKMLRRLGFDVLTAADGREGVEVFRQHADEVALVLLDLAMPEMSGSEARREILQIRSDAKVLLSSGYHEHDPSNESVAQGGSSFIQKPYRLAALRKKVRELLES